MFETHVLTKKGFEEMKSYKNDMAMTVSAVMSIMPEGREKSIFKTKIEEAIFFGAKAIAGKEGNYSDITDYPVGVTAAELTK